MWHECNVHHELKYSDDGNVRIILEGKRRVNAVQCKFHKKETASRDTGERRLETGSSRVDHATVLRARFFTLM